MKYSQVKFRPGADSTLEAELTARAEQSKEQSADVALSQVAKRDLERLYMLYQLSLPTFSENEAIIIVNALNGTKCQPEMAHRLYVDVQEYLDESETYHVPTVSDDVRMLLIRLKALSRFECMAIYDAAERFWIGGYHKKLQEVQQRLRDVGLIKA